MEALSSLVQLGLAQQEQDQESESESDVQASKKDIDTDEVHRRSGQARGGSSSSVTPVTESSMLFRRIEEEVSRQSVTQSTSRVM